MHLGLEITFQLVSIPEYFHHALGCRSWIVVHRHTLTHEVTSTTMAADFWKADKPATGTKDAKSPAAETEEDGQ